MALTDLKIKAAQPKSKPYHLTDGHGLFLAVQPNGSKLWRWKYRFQGKYRLMAFGSYLLIRLAAARAARARNCSVGLIPWRSCPDMNKNSMYPRFSLAGTPPQRFHLPD